MSQDPELISIVCIENYPSSVEVMSAIDNFMVENKMKKDYNVDIRSNIISIKLKNPVHFVK